MLHRASAPGGRDVQLNLLPVVAADNLPCDGVVAAQVDRAAATCPDDPTPGWVLGQFQSLRAQQVDVPDLPGSAPADASDPDPVRGRPDRHLDGGSRWRDGPRRSALLHDPVHHRSQRVGRLSRDGQAHGVPVARIRLTRASSSGVPGGTGTVPGPSHPARRASPEPWT